MLEGLSSLSKVCVVCKSKEVAGQLETPDRQARQQAEAAVRQAQQQAAADRQARQQAGAAAASKVFEPQ